MQQQKSSSLWVRAWGGLQQCLWSLRKSIFAFTDHPRFDQFILFVVVVNTSILVAQTFEGVALRAWYFSVVEYVFLAIYVMECILKLIAYGLLYFKSPWNDLDFVIVTMSIIDVIFHQMEKSVRGMPSSVFSLFKIFKGVRALRAFRVLRTIRFMSNLQTIVRISLQSLHAMASIILLVSFVLYVFAIIFCNMFSEHDAGRFGNLLRAMLTLYELLTLDDWSQIYSTSRDRGASHIIIFLVLYILIEYFILLNLAVAVILDNFQLAFKKRKASKIKQLQDKVKTKELLVSGPQTDKFGENTLELASIEDDTSGIGYSMGHDQLTSSETVQIREYLRLLSAIKQHQHTFHSLAHTSHLLVEAFFEAPDFGDHLE